MTNALLTYQKRLKVSISWKDLPEKYVLEILGGELE